MKTFKPWAWLGCFTFLLLFNALAAEKTAVVREGRINVRGKPSLVGEVITQLQQGETVIVLEEVAAATTKPNEPSRWLKIQMPAHTPVWVFASFIDPATKSVNATRLNLRAGPGENYSVVGRLERGAPVSEIRRVEDWMEIETPPGAYAFIAANLVTEPSTSPMTPSVGTSRPLPPSSSPPDATQIERRPLAPPTRNRDESVAPTPAPQTATLPSGPRLLPPIESRSEPRAEPPPSSTRPAEPAPSARAARGEPVEQPASSPPAGRLLPPIPDAPQPQPTASVRVPSNEPETGPSRRVVRREGLVRSTVSIQAPTYFELLSPENRKTINYLHADQLDINLKDYRGRKVVVTGEEAIDPRWPKTPLIEVETLELIP